MSLRFLVAVFCLSTFFFFDQAEADEQYTIWGNGNQSCGSWTATHNDNTDGSAIEEASQEAWVEGFITAFSAFGFTPSRTFTLDYAALKAWIDNYCSAHPLDSISKASEVLAVQLQLRVSK